MSTFTSCISKFYHRLSDRLIIGFTALFCLAAGILSTPGTVYSQGMTQVNIVGLPGVLETPYLDDQRQKFASGEYQVQFTYTNTNNLEEVPFEFNMRITRNGDEIINLISNPVSFKPGTHILTNFFEQVTFKKSFDEVINDLSSDIQKQIVQSGTLPEGQYVIQLTAERADDAKLASATPGVASFMVRFPEAPQLVSPSNQSEISLQQPTFSWTPVPYDNPSEIEYQFLLVKMHKGQKPLKAIKSNRPYAEQTLTNKTVLNYTPEYLPLEEDQQYAWMVTATHINDEIPIRNDGQSQIYTFTYQPEKEREEEEKISTITLKPGLAKLTGVDKLNWETRNNQYHLQGRANLRLMLGQTVNIPVEVRQLSIMQNNLQNPVITSGNVVGSLPDTLSVLRSAQKYLDLRNISWKLETGLRVGADIKLPGGGTIAGSGGIPGPSGSGTFRLTSSGLQGTLTATPEEEFFGAGQDTVELSINRVSVRMPSNARYFSGSISLFDGAVKCSIENEVLDKPTNTLGFLCDTPLSIALRGESSKLQLGIDAVNGTVTYNRSADSLSYNLTANAGIDLNVFQQSCGASANIQLSSSQPFKVSGIQPHCTGSTPVAHLGLFRLKISDYGVSRLEYTGAGGWDFKASVTGSLLMPALGGVLLPQTTATLTPRGLKFSNMQFTKNDLNISQPLLVGNLGIKPTRVGIDSVTFPWFDWGASDRNQKKAGPWNMSLDMKLSLPHVSGIAQRCFSNRNFDIKNATVKNGSLNANISATPIRNCTLTFSKENKLVLEEVGGSLNGSVQPDTLKAKPSLELAAHLKLGSPLDCPGGDTLDLGKTNLTLSPKGLIDGKIKNLRPSCPITFGPLDVNINQSELSFYRGSGQQQIDYAGAVSVNLMNQKKAAQGSVLVDVDDGRFKDIDLKIGKPFKLDMPRKKPALSFRIGSARIDTNGLHIDGRHNLLLYPPDTTGSTPNKPSKLGVTFDKATFNLRRATLKSGRVIFDKAFALKLGIDPQDKSLTFQATEPDSTLSDTTAALVNLGSKVIIKPNGLTTGGTAQALLNFGGRTFGKNLSIEYKQGFTIGLDPFEIKSGQANFIYNGQQVAYVDRTGFNFTAGALATALPDTLPMPTMQTAFLVIKDKQGKLKLNAQSQQSGQYSLSTTSPLTLHAPALHDSSQGKTPTFNVSFSNVVYDVQQQQLVSGSITTNLGNPLDLNYLGVPLTLTRLRFAMRQMGSGQAPSLFLEGNLNLFNRTVGQGAKASLYLQNAQRVQGSLDIPNLNAEIDLLNNSSQARLELDSLGGTVDIPIQASGVPQYTLDTRGGFWLYNSNGDTLTGANLGFTVSEGGLTIDQFNPTMPGDSTALTLGNFGLELEKLSSLNVNYNTSKQNFTFNVGLDLRFQADLQNGSTMEIPLSGTQLSKSGFSIPAQTINSNTSGFNDPQFSLGPTTIELREFDLKSKLSFNWFTGKAPTPNFSVDLGLKLSGLTSHAPELQNKWISINNVGYNQGVLTGQLIDLSNFGGDGAPISFGNNAGFTLSKIGGALTNDSTSQNPVQGFDINLDGRMNMPDFFTGAAQSCKEPQVTLNFETGWKLSGTFSNYTPCGKLKYGPATIGFNQNNKVTFAFSDTSRKMILDGGVTATVSRPNLSDVTATGNVKVKLFEGQFAGGSLTVKGPFPYKLPSTNPFLSITVQQATIDSRGFVITGSGSINYPNSQDSASVNFNQFTLDPTQGAITNGYISVQDSLAFQINVGTLQWGLVDPNSKFQASNAARILTTANFRIDSSGINLNGSSKGKLRAGGKSFDSLKINYKAFTIKFDPVRVTGGKAELVNAPNTSVGTYDKNGLHLDIEGLVKTVIPDTLGLPNRQTAFLVLGDSAGKRADLQKQGGQRTLKTKSGKQVELVMPGFKNGQDTLGVNVTFSITVDDRFNITGGSVTLASKSVDLEPYLQVPVTLQKLSYKSQNKQLAASLLVDLPKSLNNVNIKASATVDQSGFKQASLSAGKYRTNYVASQENVTPIASDSLGNGSLYFYVRGFKAAFGQNKQLSFSGQLKSKMLKDSANKKTPIHYAASFKNGSWNFNLDAGHVSGNGINLGFGRLNPKAVGSQNESMSVTLNKNEFTVAISGVLSFPKITDGFSITMQNLELSTTKPHIDVKAQGNLPDQQFHLFSGIDTVKTKNMQITLNNTVLGVKMDGSLHFYKKSISFQDMVFKTDGTFKIGGGVKANLLGDDLVVLPDSSLVFKKVAIGYQNKTLDLTVGGEAELPNPLSATSNITINADTDGNVSVTGPKFTFDKNYKIDGGPTEFGIGSFATLEVTGLGVDIDLKTPGNTAMFATGVVYVSNNESKRIMFGDQANMQSNPGIKYAPNKGVEWNISSNFDPNSSPLSFEYEFFSLTISSLQATNNVSVKGSKVPFQITLGGKTGLSIAGVSGKVGFKNFKFSTKGVDNIGQLTGGSFTLMNIVSLELGTFQYNKASKNSTVELTKTVGKKKKRSNKPDTVVTTQKKIDVKSYLKFASGSQNNALKISLTGGFSGGIKRVLYYKKPDGTFYLSIKEASIDLSSKASLAASMQYINDPSGGFLLEVAGGGQFATVGIAAAGKISTLNNQLKMGVFVAAKAIVPIVPGVLQATKLGGGFFYQPDNSDIKGVITAVKAMDPQFQLRGPQPQPKNMDFAVLLYAGFSMAGGGGFSAMSGNTLIQVTDQFTKIDANVVYLGQDNRLTGGVYLTAYYMQNKHGVKGGAGVEIAYDPLLDGTSEIDFFAMSKQNNFIWGITGNFKLGILSISKGNNLLNASGNAIISNDGMLLELGVGKGFDVAIISARASFTLTSWYIPNYSTPLGAFGKFRVSFSIVKGMAEFNAAVKGAYLKKTSPSYHLLYFAGKAHVKVVGVINGTVQGWVKFQTRSPNIDFGRGKNGKMEQMISDAKQQAKQSKKKAQETQKKINNAKNEMQNSILGPSSFTISAQNLQKAGVTMLLGDPNINYSGKKAAKVYWGYGNIYNSIPSDLKGIVFNIMRGELQANTYLGITNGGDPMPDSVKWGSLKSKAQTSVNEATNDASKVGQQITKANSELTRISNQMKTALQSQQALQLNSPVSGVQSQAVTGAGGQLKQAPSFQFNSTQDDTLRNRLTRFEQKLQKLDEQYRNAILSAGANIELVEAVTSDWKTVKWDAGNKIQIQQTGNRLSIQDVGESFLAARHELSKAYSKMTGYFWWRSKWAEHRADGLRNNEQHVKQMVGWQSGWFQNKTANELLKIGGQAASRHEAIWKLAGKPNKASSEAKKIGDQFSKAYQDMRANKLSSSDKDSLRQLFNLTGEQFYYKMPLLGLEKMEQKYEKQAVQFNNKYQKKLDKLKQAHADFTQTADRLYTLKAEMMTTLYGMIQEYKTWRNEAYGTAAPTPMKNKLGDLKKELKPPTITKIESGEGLETKNQDAFERTYYGSIEFSFKAKHPVNIPEVSLNISSGKTNSIYNIPSFETAGWLWGDDDPYTTKTLGLLKPKQNDQQTERTFSTAVRARGSGGTTISRVANITIPVEPEQGTRPSVTITPSDDSSPPTRPVVNHDYPYYRLFTYAKTNTSSNNMTFVTTMVSVGYNITQDSTRLEFFISSTDKQTGIRKYQYKIGTSMGGSDVRGWTDAQGSRMQGRNYNYVNVQGSNYGVYVPGDGYSGMKVSIYGLSLKHNKNYYFTFRTVNGAGVKSSVKKLKTPILYDRTPPEKPSLTVKPSTVQRQQAPSSPVVTSLMQTKPTFESPRTNKDWSQGSSQQYSYSWSSSDPEAGIKGFSFVTDRKPNKGADIFPDDDSYFVKKSALTKLNKVGLSYNTPEYVYLRARNYAGVKSPTAVYGPYYKMDVTPPTTPGVEARMTGGNVVLYLTQKSEDDQAHVEGYQYAIGRKAGGTSIRSWPDSIQTDFNAPTQYQWPSLSSPPRVHAIDLSALSRFHGQNIFVNVRSVNSQGMPSRTVSIRNITPDTTAPARPRLQAIYGVPQHPKKLRVQIFGTGDPQSGISSSYYRIRGKDESVLKHDSVTNNQLFVNLSLLELHRNWPVKLYLEVINGAGIEKTYEYPIELTEKARHRMEQKVRQMQGEREEEARKDREGGDQ